MSELLLKLEKQGGIYADFLQTGGIEAGIIRMHPGEKDTQAPHPFDELYYVVEGSGQIEIDGKSHQVNEGSVIFVKARAKHRFYGNKGDLLVLYVFGTNVATTE